MSRTNGARTAKYRFTLVFVAFVLFLGVLNGILPHWVKDRGYAEEEEFDGQLSYDPTELYSTDISRPITGDDDHELINMDTSIEYHIVYTQCQHKVVMPRELGSTGLTGLNKEQLEKMFQAYTIVEFSSERVVMHHYVDEFCRECYQYVSISIKDDKVAIFYGRDGAKGILKEMTDIGVNRFPREQYEQLSKGIIVNNIKDEINTVLEGLER